MNNYYSNYYNRDTLSDGAVAAVVVCVLLGIAALPDLILRQGKENGVGASGAAASRPSDGQPHVCSRCGAVLADNADFCAACGTTRQ